jgi:hypothetical protein
MMLVDTPPSHKAKSLNVNPGYKHADRSEASDLVARSPMSMITLTYSVLERAMLYLTSPCRGHNSASDQVNDTLDI